MKGIAGRRGKKIAMIRPLTQRRNQVLTVFSIVAAMLLQLYALHPASATPHTQPTVSAMPPLGQGITVADGVSMHRITIRSARGTGELRVYLPQGGSEKRPCVFVAPAGSPLICGMSLGDGDSPEQIPYARAGFIVVAYSIDGDLPKDHSAEQLIHSIRCFKASHGGVDNASEAIDYALIHIPNIDPKRRYVAGHSSAATLALQVAEQDSRIAACAAYAPVTDIPAPFGE
jgi:dipeptidyl aminopeptidase/acylaminoacyl peptidase